MRGAGRETSALSAAVVNFHYPLLKEPHIIQVRAGEAPTQLVLRVLWVLLNLNGLLTGAAD